ncbi:hypothetical protein PG984_010990 [Apiospora sp. TS-2023a]
MGDSSVDFDAIYAKEPERKSDFTGKKPRIREQFQLFWSRPDAKDDVDAYFEGLSEAPSKSPNESPSKAPSEGVSAKQHHYNRNRNLEGNWVKGSNVFTDYVNKEGTDKTIFARTSDVLIVGNHASFDIAQYPENSSPAGMSFVHLLGLTRERIYNGVSLPKEKIHLLDDIIELFKKNWSDQSFREAVLQHQMTAIQGRYDDAIKKAKEEGKPEPGSEGYELAKQHHEQLKGKIHDLEVDDFKFGLHLFPDHSIGHFHMHIVAMTKEMRRWSTSRHDMKTKDVDEVREAIKTFDRNTKTFDESKVAKDTE